MPCFLPEWGYLFEFPEQWIGQVSAVKDIKLERLRFYLLNENGETTHMLFCIDWIHSSAERETDALNSEDIVYSDDTQQYVALITDYGSDFGIEITDLISGFIKT